MKNYFITYTRTKKMMKVLSKCNSWTINFHVDNIPFLFKYVYVWRTFPIYDVNIWIELNLFDWVKFITFS